MKVQAPGEIQIAEGTKKRDLSPPTPTSPRIQHIVHKIDRQKACSHKYYTPSLAAEWKESGKRHRATQRRGFARRKEETAEGKKLRPPLQHQSPSPLGFSAVLIERLNREVKNPTGQNVITTFRQQNGRRLYIHQWENSHVSSFTMSDRPLLGRMWNGLPNRNDENWKKKKKNPKRLTVCLKMVIET